MPGQVFAPAGATCYARSACAFDRVRPARGPTRSTPTLCGRSISARREAKRIDNLPLTCRESVPWRTLPPSSALDRARSKAYLRLLPLLFLSYAIAYVDRVNVSLATIEMSKDLPAFDNAVVGFGAGVFFIGYFLLEIPGTLLVEKWSARKWICRIMVSWGFVAA